MGMWFYFWTKCGGTLTRQPYPVKEHWGLGNAGKMGADWSSTGRIVQECAVSATKLTRAPQREIAGSDGSLGAREQGLDRLLCYEVYLLIGCAGVYRHGHQLLVPPRGPLEDRILQRVQRQAELRGRVALGGLHLSAARAQAAPSSAPR